jgi:plasmid stabilization system protein ParE
MNDGGKLAWAVVLAVSAIMLFAVFIANSLEPAWFLLPLAMLGGSGVAMLTRKEQYEAEKRRRVINLTQAEQSEQAALSRVSELRSALQGLIEAAQAAELKARSALAHFERSSLRHSARLVPFPSLPRAQVGRVVRVRDSSIASYQKDFDRTVQIVDDLPAFFGEDGIGEAESRTRLFKVRAISADKIVLSRGDAYAEVRGSLAAAAP